MTSTLEYSEALSAGDFVGFEFSHQTSVTERGFSPSGFLIGGRVLAERIKILKRQGASAPLPDYHGMMYASTPKFEAQSLVFNLIAAFYLKVKTPRDRKIAARLTTLCQDAFSEEESVKPASLRQLLNFFISHPDLALPKITLTPDGTLRVRWVRAKEDFTAIEFTGEPIVKLAAEIPRNQGLTARYFSSELLSNILGAAHALGASFV